ncbi:MAG: glycosyltransferase, partial [Muribaculaceae bacterium]|nr:glycosyltransferase [Muribaculaceae bacterium]
MTVSLIVSTYNSVPTLAVCLDSILRQTRMPDEIIIGDDG